MEKIITPGLQHLAENIFLNLIYTDLKKCQLINNLQVKSWTIQCSGLKNWFEKDSQGRTKRTHWSHSIWDEFWEEKHIAAYLQWNLKKKNLFNFPCYTKPAVQEDFRIKIQKIYMRLHKGSFSSSLLHFPVREMKQTRRL